MGLYSENKHRQIRVIFGNAHDESKMMKHGDCWEILYDLRLLLRVRFIRSIFSTCFEGKEMSYAKKKISISDISSIRRVLEVRVSEGKIQFDPIGRSTNLSHRLPCNWDNAVGALHDQCFDSKTKRSLQAYLLHSVTSVTFSKRH